MVVVLVVKQMTIAQAMSFCVFFTMSISDSRQQTADSRQQTADSGQQTADSRQQTAGSRQQTADSRLLCRVYKQ
jgi:hypothetical protein